MPVYKCAIIFSSSCLDLSLPLEKDVRIGAADAHHEVAEGTVDVLAAALQGRRVGGVHQVDSQVAGLRGGGRKRTERDYHQVFPLMPAICPLKPITSEV